MCEIIITDNKLKLGYTKDTTNMKSIFEDKVIFGKKIKKFRIDKGLTQKEFSNIIGIKQSYYSEVENGKRSITTRIISELRDKFNISIDSFMSDESTSPSIKIETSINKRFKNTRLALGMTQSLFANKLGISQASLSDIERCRTNISINILQILYLEYEIDLNWLITGISNRHSTFTDNPITNNKNRKPSNKGQKAIVDKKILLARIPKEYLIELANRAGVSTKYVSNYFNDKNNSLIVEFTAYEVIAEIEEKRDKLRKKAKL